MNSSIKSTFDFDFDDVDDVYDVGKKTRTTWNPVKDKMTGEPLCFDSNELFLQWKKEASEVLWKQKHRSNATLGDSKIATSITYKCNSHADCAVEVRVYSLLSYMLCEF